MTTRRSALLIRKTATLAAVILLLGQMIAAAHFHRVSRHQEFTSTVVSAADGSCAICVAQLHSPAVSAVAPALIAPEPVERPVLVTASTGPLAASVSLVFGRAPPQLA